MIELVNSIVRILEFFIMYSLNKLFINFELSEVSLFTTKKQYIMLGIKSINY